MPPSLSMACLNKVAVAVAGLMLCCPAWAQRGGPPAAPGSRSTFPWWESRISSDLSLTDEQKAEIKDVLAATKASINDLRRSSDRADKELEAVFDEDPVDQHRANEAIEKVARARSELTRAYSQLSLKLRAVLTGEQWQELQRRLDSRTPPAPRNSKGEPKGPPRGGSRRAGSTQDKML